MKVVNKKRESIIGTPNKVKDVEYCSSASQNMMLPVLSATCDTEYLSRRALFYFTPPILGAAGTRLDEHGGYLAV
jgi:hypothetical protein